MHSGADDVCFFCSASLLRDPTMRRESRTREVQSMAICSDAKRPGERKSADVRDTIRQHHRLWTTGYRQTRRRHELAARVTPCEQPQAR